MTAFLLDPTVTFLNHGSFGACPQPVFAAYQNWQLELERRPVEFLSRKLEDRLTQVRERLGRAVGTAADNLGLVANVTTAINAVARSLPPGQVLSSNHEYGAVNMTWQEWGHELVLVEATAETYVERLWEAVTPATRVLSLSQITSPTGLIMPVAELVRRARERGILTVVDGAHVPGHLDLNVDALGADFYAGNLHKWMCAPKGSAFLATRPEHHSLVRPLVKSWAGKRTSAYVDALMGQGTRDPAAFLTIPDALDWSEAHHGQEVRSRCRELVRSGRRRLLELVGSEPLAGEEYLGQMAAVELPARVNPEAMLTWMVEEAHVEVPISAWYGRPLLRFSIQSYNRPQDVDRLLEAVATYLKK